MDMEKVRLTIGGTNYTVLTDKGIDYTEKLALEIDEKLSHIISAGRFLSVNQAVVLLSLEYADSAKCLSEENESLRERLRSSLEDCAKAKTKRDSLERENQKLKAELKELKKKNTEK